MSFKGIEGSGDKAVETLTWLRSESDRLGTSFIETAASYKSFLAAAKTSGMAEQDIRDIYTAVSGAGAVLGMDSQQQARSLMALQQMLSKGTVSAEELRQQLGENLPGAFAMAAEAMNVTESQLAKMMERGEVAATDLLPRLAKVLKEKYGDSVKDASDTGAAAAARFGSAWKDLEATFYNSSVITSTLDKMTAAIKKLSGGPADAVDTVEKMTARIAALRKQQANALYSDEKAEFGRRAAELEAKRTKEIEKGYIAAGKALPADSWLSFDRDKIEADVRGFKMLEEQAKKTLEAQAQVVAAQGSLAQVKAEINGDPMLIELTKIQEGYKKFKAEMASKMADKELSRDGLNALAATVTIEGKKVRLLEDFARRSLSVQREAADAETQLQLDNLMGLDSYLAQQEATRAKHAEAMQKPGSLEAHRSMVLSPVQLAVNTRTQDKKHQETSLGLEGDLSKLRGEYYGTTAGHSAAGTLAEQAAQVEIERKQKLLAIHERLAAVAISVIQIEAKGANTPEEQAELERKVQELGLLEQYRDVLNDVSSIKQREILASRSWQSGARKGFQDYADAASNYASQAENAVKNAFSGMEDSLASFTVKGKGNWSSLVETILMDLVKIQTRSSLTGPLSTWLGGLNILGSAHGNVLDGPGISALSNGIYSSPTFFGFDQHVTAFARGGVLAEERPEAVMPLVRDSGGNLGVRAQGGGDTFNVSINLNVAASSGSQSQDKAYADTLGESVSGAMDAWWEDKYRQAHRPGAIGNGGVNL